MIQISISGGTPKSGPSLCKTCKHAKAVKGQNCQEVVFCHMFATVGAMGRVPFRVAECQSYHPSNVPWLHEMEDMAWRIEARRRGPMGFSDPETGEQMEVIITKPRTKRGYGSPPE